MPRKHVNSVVPLIFCSFTTAACFSGNPAFALGGDGVGGSASSGLAGTSTGPDGSSGMVPTGGGSGSLSDSATQGGDPGATGSTTQSSISDAGTSDAITSSTGTADPGDSTGAGVSTGSTGSSTGDGTPVCMEAVVGEPPHLAVKQDGQPLVACAGVRSLTKAFAKFSGATLQLYDSGTCAQTGSLYEITGVNFAITPVDLGESCSDARIEWAPGPVCEVTGFGLRNGDQPVLVGAFGRLRGPTNYTAFTAQPQQECGCEVDGVACCDHVFELDQKLYQPGGYSLGFPGADGTIAPGDSINGTVGRADYQFRNLRSDVGESCVAGPSNVWLDMRWWATANN